MTPWTASAHLRLRPGNVTKPSSHRFGEGPARSFALRNINVVGAALVAFGPGRVGMQTQPVRSGGGQDIKRGAQCLDRTAEAVQRPHGAEHMRGIGPLAPVLDQEPVFAAQSEKPVEQQSLGLRRCHGKRLSRSRRLEIQRSMNGENA